MTALAIKNLFPKTGVSPRRGWELPLRIPRSSFFFLLVVSLAGAGFQTLSLLFLLDGRVFPGVAAHLALPAAVWRITRWQKRNPTVYNLWILLGFSSLFLSVIGVMGWFITYILCSLVFKPKNAMTEYKDYIHLKYTREEILRELALEPYSRDRRIPWEKGELAPYIDILKGKDTELKLAVIEKLSLTPDHTHINMLKSALTDENDEVRLAAAANLRKIEDRLNRKIMELKLEARLQPTNDQVLAELGMACDEYAFSGILDEEITAFYRQQAADAFYKAIQTNPFAEEYYKNLGRTLLRMGRIEESIRVLEQGLEINPRSQSIFLWLMEYHYNRKDFAKVREMAGRISPEQVENERMQQIIRWWAEGR